MYEHGLTIAALIIILMIPGPTNALLASSARHVGFSRSLSLIPAELMGYIYAMSLWWLLIKFTEDIWPALMYILHFVSAVYVFWLAFNLWKMNQLQAYSQKIKEVKPTQLFYATFKNPKALLFAVGVFPSSIWSSLENYAVNMLLFSLILIPAALFWLLFGSQLLTGKFKGIDQEQLYKGSALLLLVCMLPIMIRFLH